MVRGAGTVLNIATVLAGAAVGMLLGRRMPARTRDVVTDALGLVTLLAAALSAAAVLDQPLRRAVGAGAVLVVLGSLLVGGVAVAGSLLRLEDRLESLGGRLQRAGTLRGAAPAGTDATPDDATTVADDRRERFVQGFLTASLVFASGRSPSWGRSATASAGASTSSRSRRRSTASPPSRSRRRSGSASPPRRSRSVSCRAR